MSLRITAIAVLALFAAPLSAAPLLPADRDAVRQQQ